MTFHTLRAISQLIVAGQEGENCAYTCAAHDKRFAGALFVLCRVRNGIYLQLQPKPQLRPNVLPPFSAFLQAEIVSVAFHGRSIVVLLL